MSGWQVRCCGRAWTDSARTVVLRAWAKHWTTDCSVRGARA